DVPSMKLTDALILRYGSRARVPDALWAAAQKRPDLSARPPVNQVGGAAVAAGTNDCHQNGTWVGLCLWDGWGASGYMLPFPYGSSCGRSFELGNITVSG